MCAPDDGWSYHPKHVEFLQKCNKLQLYVLLMMGGVNTRNM